MEAQRTVIKLSGSLAAKFGRTHVRYLDSGSTREAFSALKHTLKGFEQFIIEQAKYGMRYAIFRNGKNVGEDEFALAGTQELRIVPVIQGSKRAGVLQTIIGAVLVVVGVFTTIFGDYSGSVIAAGVSMMAGGVVQMLSPQNLSMSDSEDSGTSYAFGGAVNTSAAGNPVPVGYGKRKVGGAIISAGIYTEDQRATSNATAFGNRDKFGTIED
ncbi:tail assembly protein [Shewanella mangrovi]|uniref:tail assembly protein n=1 Tax=Shewanella mangrovi TaxID=1515746 RepID=UPI0009DF088E|nr:tail assembly protein [Shewanella mangrovi]